jgi:predicted sulfurtransferase
MMLKRKINNLLAVTILAFAMQACNTTSPTTEPELAPTQKLVATQIIEPVFTPSQAALPQSEDAVPRVSVEEAKAALESGAAIIVDVRSSGAYEASHIPGAINIRLEEFETNPTNLKLGKEQWIITYCT